MIKFVIDILENKRNSKQQSVSSSKTTKTRSTKEEYGQESVNNPNHNKQRAKNCSTRKNSGK
jgi:hypothetical protein